MFYRIQKYVLVLLSQVAEARSQVSIKIDRVIFYSNSVAVYLQLSRFWAYINRRKQFFTVDLGKKFDGRHSMV